MPSETLGALPEPLLPGPPRVKHSRLFRLALATWQILVGYILAGSPQSRLIWHEGFYAFWPSVQEILFQPFVRIGISSIGVALLVFGSWDIAGLIIGRDSKR
jgi:hypothetical protein